jgi:DNA-binding CsgD family transcriptional regulator
MKPGRAIGLTHCPNCGARIVPTPKEFKQWRKAAGLTQRKLAALLKITASHVNYLENGKRSPSAALIARYWKFSAAAIASLNSAFTLTERQRQVTELRSAGLTYAAIGRQLGISGERVRQIEMRLLRRVRLN